MRHKIPLIFLFALSLFSWMPAHAGFLNLFNAEVNIYNINLGAGAGFSGAIVADGKNYLDVKFNDDKDHFKITVMPLYSFEDTIFDDSKHLKLAINDGYWDLTFVLDFTDSEGDATFRVASNVMHIIKPDGLKHLADKDKGDPFKYSFPTISAEAYRLAGNAAKGSLSLDASNVDHLPTHIDRYSGNVGYDLNYGADHFNGWDFEFKGNHIPEPASLPLLVAGLGILIIRTKQQTRLAVEKARGQNLQIRFLPALLRLKCRT